MSRCASWRGPGSNQFKDQPPSDAGGPLRPDHAVISDVHTAAAADLDHFVFDEDDLRGADMESRVLYGSQFTFCDASNANFQGSDLRRTLFFHTDLSNADLSNADLRGARFRDCNLTGAQFDGACYDDDTFIDHDPREAGMVPAQEAKA